MELHVYFIYNILKRKLQVLVYVMPGICIKSYIKTKKKTICAIRSEKKKCNQSLSSKYEENQWSKDLVKWMYFNLLAYHMITEIILDIFR